jgi:glycerophosphoryl diester phosphodiesterase
VHPHLAALGERFAPAAVERAHELGMELNVWTVNDPAEIVRLAATRVDAIITDTPAAARAVLDA